IALGPAVVAGLTGMARSLPWLLTAAAVAALAATDASGLVRGEVERIWLPFVPWLLIATGGLRGGERSARRWLLGQGALAMGRQASLGVGGDLPAGSGGARPHAPRAGRARGLPPAPRPGAGSRDHAHRAGRGRRPGLGTGAGGRRLHGQALLASRVGGAREVR